MVRRILRRLALGTPVVGKVYENLSSLEHNVAALNALTLKTFVSLERDMAKLNARIDVMVTHKILPHPGYAKYAHGLYSALKPMDVVDGTMIRKGRAFDGGYVMLDEIGKNAIAYSLGISDDVSWDLDIAAAGLQIFQYDPTITALPAAHPHFHFYKTGVAGAASADGSFKTLHSLLEGNGHWGRRDLILKMDIEGSEWDVLNTPEEDVFEHFSQIVVELHHLTNADMPGHARMVTEGLEKMNRTHQVAHLHANNCGYTGLIGGVFLPDVLEVTYVRKSDHQFQACAKTFPTAIDRPCNQNAPDIYLGRLGTD